MSYARELMPQKFIVGRICMQILKCHRLIAIEEVDDCACNNVDTFSSFSVPRSTPGHFLGIVVCFDFLKLHHSLYTANFRKLGRHSGAGIATICLRNELALPLSFLDVKNKQKQKKQEILAGQSGKKITGGSSDL